MKNLFKGVSILLLSLVVISCFAQKKAKPFQGTITYTISYEGEIEPAQKAQMPTESTLYLKGDKSREEMKMAMGSQVSIADKATQDMIMLLNMMGQKMAITSNYKEMSEDKTKTTVKLLDEIKEIAGYTCKSAEVIIKVEDQEVTSVYYYTEDINYDNPNWSEPFKEINGVIMEYTVESEKFKMINTVSKVKKGKLKDELFAIPAGYKTMTMDEFKTLMGG